MSQFNFNEKFRERTLSLSMEVISWYAGIQPKPDEVKIIGKQLIRSVTSTAANFRAACRARSQTERLARLSTVVQESDETVFWLELFGHSGLVNDTLLVPIQEEALEILKVMATYRKNLTAKS